MSEKSTSRPYGRAPRMVNPDPDPRPAPSPPVPDQVAADDTDPSAVDPASVMLAIATAKKTGATVEIAGVRIAPLRQPDGRPWAAPASRGKWADG